MLPNEQVVTVATGTVLSIWSRTIRIMTGRTKTDRTVKGMLAAGIALAAMPSIVQAQVAVPASTAGAAAEPTVPSVDGYVCRFARVCAPQATSEVDMAAPGTRTFRLGQSSATRAPGLPTGVTNVTGSQQSPVSRTYTASGAGNDRNNGPAGRTRGPSRVPHRVASGLVQSAPRIPAAGAALASRTAPRADLMIGFDLNSAQLSAAGRESARVFAQALLQPALLTKRFVVEGHTDLRGGRPLNLALSSSRARAVVDFLVAQGVERSRLEARGLGPDVPLPGHRNTDPANRRVEAELVP